MFTYGTYPAVAQVVDIIDFRLLVDQADEVLDNRYDVLFCQYQGLFAGLQLKLAVNLVASYFAKVVPLIGEEQLIDNTASRFLVGRISTAQLAVNVLYRFYFGARRVFLQRIVYNGVILINLIFLKDYYFGVRLQDRLRYCPHQARHPVRG